jgi:RNA polymerase sigma factor (sigma-70 family)
VYECRVQHDVTDDALVRAALEGDAAAFGVLVERYQELAFRVAWLVTRDAGSAQDACQEAFIRAYRNLHRFRLGEPFRPWLLRIVTNLARNQVRSSVRRGGLLDRLRRRGPATVGSNSIAEVDSGPERAVEAAERHEAVMEALAALRLEDREVLYLRHFLDLPEREIAEVLRVAPGTVKSRLSRARARLREVIERLTPRSSRTTLSSPEDAMTEHRPRDRRPPEGWEERLLRETAAAVAYPPTPDLRWAVLASVSSSASPSPHLWRGGSATIGSKPLSGLRFRLAAAALAVFALLVAATLAIEPARTAVAEFFGLVEGERIENLPAPPSAGPQTGQPAVARAPTPVPLLRYARPMTLQDARASLPWEPRLPEGAGEPEGVYALSWNGQPVLILQYAATSRRPVRRATSARRRAGSRSVCIAQRRAPCDGAARRATAATRGALV